MASSDTISDQIPEGSNVPALLSLFGEKKGLVLTLDDDEKSRLREKYNGRRVESPSSIKSFVGCPGGWYAERYVFPRTPSSFPAVVGTFVHRVLEGFYNGPPETWTRRNLESQFKRAWQEICGEIDKALIPPDLQDDFDRLEKEEGSWFRGKFYNQAKHSISNVEEFDDMETINVLTNEIRGALEINGITINGRIDRIEIDRDGNEIIGDWKTGRDPDDSIPIDVEHKDFIPSGLYYLMRRAEAGKQGRKVTNVELLFLKSGKAYVITIDDHVDAQAESLAHSVTTAMNEIEDSGVLPLIPSRDNCIFCPLKKLCPAKKTGAGKTLREAADELLGVE